MNNQPEHSLAEPDATLPLMSADVPRKRLSKAQKRIGALTSALLFLLGVALIFAFLYYQSRYGIAGVIRSWGLLGVAAAILLMALLCVIPVPSEFLLIMDMNVYGIAFGILYSWAGVILGTLGIFWVSRFVGRPWLSAYVPPERIQQIEAWVSDRGSIGLLMARLLPVPVSVVNYIAGLIRSVSWWGYLWTSVVSVIPYYVTAALIYLGASRRLVAVLAIGVGAVAVFWIAGYLFSQTRHSKRG